MSDPTSAEADVSVSVDEPAGPALSIPPADEPAADAPPAPELLLTVVEPRAGFSVADARELWRYRELFYYLILRELKLRYKQTVLGVGWSLFQPIATTAVFVVLIGWMGNTGGPDQYPGGVPRVLYVLLGVLPWTFFASAVQNAGNSLVANERLVTKVYFPRLLLPLSNVGSAAFDFAVALGLAAAVMGWYGVAPGGTTVFAPLVLGLLFLTATGVGVLLSALIVAQRDFRYLLTFGIQLWMFGTPCIFATLDRIGPAAKMILPVNPVYGLILAFRNLALGVPFDGYAWYALGMSASVGVLLLAAGLLYFRRVERTFADTI